MKLTYVLWFAFFITGQTFSSAGPNGEIPGADSGDVGAMKADVTPEHIPNKFLICPTPLPNNNSLKCCKKFSEPKVSSLKCDNGILIFTTDASKIMHMCDLKKACEN